MFTSNRTGRDYFECDHNPDTCSNSKRTLEVARSQSRLSCRMLLTELQRLTFCGDMRRLNGVVDAKTRW